MNFSIFTLNHPTPQSIGYRSLGRDSNVTFPTPTNIAQIEPHAVIPGVATTTFIDCGFVVILCNCHRRELKMTFESITFAVESGIARITLNRPDKLNSFTGEMHAELRIALDSIQTDSTIRVLVLTGAGRAFCAGQDLADTDMQVVNGKMPDIGNVVEKNYKQLVLRLQSLRVPTIAAVNGIAAGAGASVALACDLVIATKSASFLQAFSKIGLIPDTGGTWFLPQRVGMARAMGLAMLADKLPAEKAADWGLIWECTEDANFAARIDTLAKQLSVAPTKALVRTRQAMHAAPSHTLEQQLSFEGGFMRELGWSPDYAEGVAAFMEKRAPNFTGE